MTPGPKETPTPTDKNSLAEDKPFSVLTRFTKRYLNPTKAKFVFLRKKGKRPYETGWTTTANYSLSDPKLAQHLAEGGNSGYLIGSEDIRLIDADVIDHLEKLGVLEGLKDLAAKTLSTSSGNPRGSFHIWIDCPEIEGGSKRYDPVNPVFNEEGKEVPVLEILGVGNQVVCPGSTHPSGTTYRVVNDLPIVKVSKEEVFRLLEGLSQHKTGEREADKKKSGKKASKKRKEGNYNNKIDENVVITTFIKLGDGRMLEQVGSFGKYQFAIWDGQTVAYAKEIEYSGLIYRPRQFDLEMSKYVKFPTQAEEYTSLSLLLGEIESVLKTYMDVSPTFLMIATLYIPMTYIYDKLRSVIYLRMLGEPGTGKSRMLSTIAHCCHKPILTMGNTSAAAVTRLLKQVPGTLMLDEMDLYDSSEANQLMKIWNSGHSIDAAPMKCDVNDPDKVSCVPCFCPKLAGTRKRFKDKAAETRCVTEICQQTEREEITNNLPMIFYEQSEHIRNKLLMWRFRNYDKVTGDESEQIKLENVDRRIKQSFSSLAYIILHSEKGMETFKTAILQSENDMIEQNATSFEGAVVRAYKELHDEGIEEVTPTQITSRMECVYKFINVKPESVGKVLNLLHVDRGRTKKSSFVIYDERKMQRIYDRYIIGYKVERLAGKTEGKQQLWENQSQETSTV